MNASTESLVIRTQAERISDAYLGEPGRPPILNDTDKVQILLAALRDGNYRETACKLAGISKQTLYNALKRAEAGDEQAILFVDALEKAEALAESETVGNVRSASKLPQFWAAGMTWLERKSPDRWGRRQDDTSAPKVIVQIGARDSDVQVQINTTFASETSAVSPVMHSLTGDVESDNAPYVSLSGSVPAVLSLPDQGSAAANPAGDPTGSGALYGSDAGLSVKGDEPDGAVSGKGRSRGGVGRRKKEDQA